PGAPAPRAGRGSVRERPAPPGALSESGTAAGIPRSASRTPIHGRGRPDNRRSRARGANRRDGVARPRAASTRPGAPGRGQPRTHMPPAPRFRERTAAVVLALALAAPIRAGGQEKPVVRVSLELIQVDAVVTDGAGRYVTDLTADDFELREDGRLRAITHCS